MTRTSLRTWARRARPGRVDLGRAAGAGVLASLASTGLFVGAIGLLVASAGRPGLRSVGAILIAIELVAFARSPLRFFERISAHRLGYAAVAHWRSWLVRRVGELDYDRFAIIETGDLLERALRDTDELQSLWLRVVLPAGTAVATFALGDVAVGLLAPHGGWIGVAVTLAAVQVAACGLLLLATRRLRTLDTARRVARSQYRSRVLEVAQVAPDLALLGRTDVARSRLHEAAEHLRGAEGRVARADVLGGLVVAVASLGVLDALTDRPTSAPLWICVVVAWGLATADLLGVLRAASQSAVEVGAGAGRLEDFEVPSVIAGQAWPAPPVVNVAPDLSRRKERVRCEPGARLAVTGRSGSGKSTLLRELAGLRRGNEPRCWIGDVEPVDIDDVDLHQHLAYVPPEPSLVTGFVADTVVAGRSTTGDLDAVLTRLGLPEANVALDEPSRGERARLAVARALIGSASVIILDEPTVGLGDAETAAVLDLLAESGATVIVATHDERVIEWCDGELRLD